MNGAVCSLKRARDYSFRLLRSWEITEEIDVPLDCNGHSVRRVDFPSRVLSGTLYRWILVVVFFGLGCPEGFSQQGATQPAGQNQAPSLSPEQQAALEQLLVAWEARNAKVTTWSCTFYKWQYNAWSPADASGERLAFSESSGEIKYAAPDKGLFHVKSSKQWNPEKRIYDARPSNSGEHWVCNGTSIYEFRHSERQLRETKLPPEMRGRAISEGPLPFVFGAKADTLKKRYSMRIITPATVTDQIWLEALPKFQVDAANFSKVELILRATDLMPFAIQIFKPGGQDRDVYQFDPRTSLIDRGLDLIRDFSRPLTPLGYTFIEEQAPGS